MERLERSSSPSPKANPSGLTSKTERRGRGVYRQPPLWSIYLRVGRICQLQSYLRLRLWLLFLCTQLLKKCILGWFKKAGFMLPNKVCKLDAWHLTAGDHPQLSWTFGELKWRVSALSFLEGEPRKACLSWSGLLKEQGTLVFSLPKKEYLLNTRQYQKEESVVLNGGKLNRWWTFLNLDTRLRCSQHFSETRKWWTN